jgi:16S rRNA processing protein RimM
VGAQEETSEKVLVGRVRRPVGLRGEVIIGPTGDDPTRFSPGRHILLEGSPLRELVVRTSRPTAKGAIAVHFEGIDSVEEAEGLRNLRLYVRPADLPQLPDGVYYHYQLIGLEVFDVQQERLGRVTAILETGSHDVYCVGKGTKEILVPAVPDFVAEINLSAGRILLAVPRSALEVADPPS